MSLRSLVQTFVAIPLRHCPPRALWSDRSSQGRRARSALSMAADMAAVEVAEQEEEEAGDIFVSFRPFTESPVFIGVQVGYICLFFPRVCAFFLCPFVHVCV